MLTEDSSPKFSLKRPVQVSKHLSFQKKKKKKKRKG